MGKGGWKIYDFWVQKNGVREIGGQMNEKTGWKKLVVWV